jgi:hypothetical protein
VDGATTATVVARATPAAYVLWILPKPAVTVYASVAIIALLIWGFSESRWKHGDGLVRAVYFTLDQLFRKFTTIAAILIILAMTTAAPRDRIIRRAPLATDARSLC